MVDEIAHQVLEVVLSVVPVARLSHNVPFAKLYDESHLPIRRYAHSFPISPQERLKRETIEGAVCPDTLATKLDVACVVDETPPPVSCLAPGQLSFSIIVSRHIDGNLRVPFSNLTACVSFPAPGSLMTNMTDNKNVGLDGI